MEVMSERRTSANAIDLNMDYYKILGKHQVCDIVVSCIHERI